ncbi:hypothetical protein K461DRAFT_266349 [Myriangium duriaei CBS 260.36]|uniref:Uncharacterized protein n=1 Tax=Myriangium duriaei CBS 260.36 TaxID=1168546 RepID=A0A9P4J8E7_9PEZI|nr:hypothetical protein K461DRAFT_266349 [Myriangium duriaei CBS 260.36]
MEQCSRCCQRLVPLSLLRVPVPAASHGYWIACDRWVSISPVMSPSVTSPSSCLALISIRRLGPEFLITNSKTAAAWRPQRQLHAAIFGCSQTSLGDLSFATIPASATIIHAGSRFRSPQRMGDQSKYPKLAFIPCPAPTSHGRQQPCQITRRAAPAEHRRATQRCSNAATVVLADREQAGTAQRARQPQRRPTLTGKAPARTICWDWLCENHPQSLAEHAAFTRPDSRYPVPSTPKKEPRSPVALAHVDRLSPVASNPDLVAVNLLPSDLSRVSSSQTTSFPFPDVPDATRKKDCRCVTIVHVFGRAVHLREYCPPTEFRLEKRLCLVGS